MHMLRKARSARAKSARVYLLVVPVLVGLVVSVAFVPHLLGRPGRPTADLLWHEPAEVTVRSLPGTTVRMPVLGFGTAALKNSREAIECALAAGYRLLDTAAENAVWYRNERMVGELAAQYPPKHVFVTSKLHPEDHGTRSADAAINRTLENLGGRVDLLLIHAPRCWPGVCEKEPEGTWEDSWAVMEKHVRAGHIGAIGVSNFGERELRRLLDIQTVPVAVLQNWFDPFHQDRVVRALCAENGIHYQGYSTLGTQWWGKGIEPNPVLTDQRLMSWAAQRGISVSQLVLRWALQEGVSVVPRSNSCDHIRENLAVLGMRAMRLGKQEVHGIRAMDGTLDGRARDARNA